MTSSQHANRLLIAACLAALVGCRAPREDESSKSGRHSAGGDAPTPATKLELTGTGLARPTTFTLEQLRAMPMEHLTDLLMQRSNAPDLTTSWRGPSVRSLLQAAGIRPGPMNVTFEATDGYYVRCPLAELRSAIIALQDGQGRWLADLDENCPLRLVPPEKTGNFWIMNPTRILVEPRRPE